MTKQFDLFADPDSEKSEKSHEIGQKYSTDPMIASNVGGSAKLSLSQFYDGELLYVPNWLTATQANEAFKTLRQSLAWQQDRIRLYGKWITIPRMQAWYGEVEARYQYSGIEMQPLPWTPLLAKLRRACEKKCDSGFNSVLANLYRDGADSMGMHSDDEPELGDRPVIASLTLGQARRFDLKHKRDKTQLQIHLGHGSLLVMHGETQQYWQHGIQKTKKQLSERINLTFRNIKVSKP